MKLREAQSPLLKSKKMAATLRRIFFVVFAVAFTLLFAQVVFANPHFNYAPWLVVGFALLWGALFCFGYWFTARFGGLLQGREKLCLLAAALVILATQLLFYWQLGAYPTMDFERVFTGAVNYTVNGFIEEPYLDYFYKYPNNMPLTILLSFFFRAFHRLGYSNFYVVGALVNAGCMLLTYGLVYAIVRRLLGVPKAFFAILLLYLCIPLQSQISIFYTDTITLPFAPFAFYCYLRLRDAKSWKGILLASTILAAGMALGAKLKYSVVIALIAIGVDLLLRLDWRRLAAVAGLFLLLFFTVSSLFNAAMYGGFLDEAVAADRATPFNAWIMMGLERDGTHDPDDNYLIWNQPTAQAKREKADEEIQRRLAQYSPVGFLAFLNQKALRSWGSGNMDVTRTVANSPMRQTFLVECISPGGRYYAVFDTLMQGYHVALFALVTWGAVMATRRRDYRMFVPCLALFGLFLFLLLWESGQRYLTNYYAMAIVAGAFGMAHLAHSVAGRVAGKSRAWREGEKT